jgi:hypothetical protein
VQVLLTYRSACISGAPSREQPSPANVVAPTAPGGNSMFQHFDPAYQYDARIAARQLSWDQYRMPD